jgi:hypothetical protein
MLTVASPGCVRAGTWKEIWKIAPDAAATTEATSVSLKNTSRRSPAYGAKFEPATVTLVPGAPDFGERKIAGAAIAVAGGTAANMAENTIRQMKMWGISRFIE